MAEYTVELQALPPEERDRILIDGWTEERSAIVDGRLIQETITHPSDGHAALRQFERRQAEDNQG